jgi:RNA polymerase sigma factor (sigma-70 family)
LVIQPIFGRSRMSDSASVTTLRRLLVGQYDELKKQLTRRLGSEDLAGEVLQETYLHLERPAQIGTLSSPKQYLLMIATNIARMSLRRERRWASMLELDAALGLVDEAPDPLQSLEARKDIEALQRAFEELTPRRQRILFASRIEGMQLSEIAAELGLSERAVSKELKTALMLCGHRLKREVVQRFGPRPRESSTLVEVEENAVRDARDD